MAPIILTEKSRGQKRRRSSFLLCAVLAFAGSSLEVTAFGVTTITPNSKPRASSSLRMKPEKVSSYRNNKQSSRTKNGSSSSELISRKSALVDSSHISDAATNASNNKGIRDRVNRFLRSKKNKSKVVQEVRDIDSIYTLLGEGQKEAVYTAVIFHAPYCRACKASMPLFEELARQYNKKNKKYAKQLQQKGSTWLETQKQQYKQPIVKFLSVPVTQDNSKELQDQLNVDRFPLAHIYDPFDGLVDERPVLRKLFPGFEERLESVVVASASAESVSQSPSFESSPVAVTAVAKNVTMA